MAFTARAYYVSTAWLTRKGEGPAAIEDQAVPGLDERPYTRIVDVASEKSGHGLFFVHGVPSEQPPAIVPGAAVSQVASEEDRARLARLNEEIDRLYDQLDALRQHKKSAEAEQKRTALEHEITRYVQLLKVKQTEAAMEMRRQFDESGVRQCLDEGLRAIKRAKELLQTREDSSEADEAR